jgi:hypothetical protein
MINFETQEVLEEIKDLISAHQEAAEDMDDDEKLSTSEDILQDILDRIAPILEREA